MRKIFFLTFVLMLFFIYCSKKPPVVTPEIASSDEALFKLGEAWMKKDPEKARLYFRQVIDTFPQSIYAQRAKLKLGDIYFNQGDEGSMILASSEYAEFISLYPFSPLASYARYQIAMTYYKKMFKPGRDQTNTLKAVSELEKVIADYPYSEEAKQAKEKLKICKNRYTEHIFLIGRFYYKTRAYEAAINRFKEALSYYSDFKKLDMLYYYLGDSFLKVGKKEEAFPYFSKIISDYPESKFAKKARKKLDKEFK
ncbi:MAG: outer membrane protein assembly factor BamD [Acidobacteriota bacterium]